MKKYYFTMTGTNHYYGTEFLEEGTKFKIKKEPEGITKKLAKRQGSRWSALQRGA